MDAFTVPYVVGHIVVVPEAAGAKLENEAFGNATVLLKRHKGWGGHHRREEKARTGVGREGGGAPREGGGALKVELAFRRNPKTARGGGRHREGGERRRADTAASFQVAEVGFSVEGERGEAITMLRSRGRMLQRHVVIRKGGLALRVVKVTNAGSQFAEGASLGSQALSRSRGTRPLGFPDADAATRESKKPKHKVPSFRAAAGAAPHPSRRRHVRRGGRGGLANRSFKGWHYQRWRCRFRPVVSDGV